MDNNWVDAYEMKRRLVWIMNKFPNNLIESPINFWDSHNNNFEKLSELLTMDKIKFEVLTTGYYNSYAEDYKDRIIHLNNHNNIDTKITVNSDIYQDKLNLSINSYENFNYVYPFRYNQNNDLHFITDKLTLQKEVVIALFPNRKLFKINIYSGNGYNDSKLLKEITI